MTPAFFFDTADAKYIHKILELLTPHITTPIQSFSVVGVTTNPNALNKIGASTLNDVKFAIKDIDDVLLEYSQYAKNSLSSTSLFRREIHIQIPNSQMSLAEVTMWVNEFNNMDLHNKLIFKVPPTRKILDAVNLVGWPTRTLNVTGLADAASVLWALTYPSVKYASIIPGRMSAVGIDPEEVNYHLQFLGSRSASDGKFVIAGSMRTLQGLQQAINNRTVPTIGSRVWDLFTDETYANFMSMWDGSYNRELDYHSINIDSKHNKLSQDFFESMDELGRSVYEDFMGERLSTVES